MSVIYWSYSLYYHFTDIFRLHLLSYHTAPRVVNGECINCESCAVNFISLSSICSY